MTGARQGLARSVKVRLVKHAKAIRVDPNFVLTGNDREGERFASPAVRAGSRRAISDVGHPERGQHGTRADSMVLERTACFGSCPAYRLRITRLGEVAFHSRNFGDTLRTAVATIPGADATGLIRFADMMAFEALPDTIARVRAYCESTWTDHPTATTTIFVGTGYKRVVDYQGCWWAPAALRRLENLIDSTTHSSRWVRPNDLRRAAPPA